MGQFFRLFILKNHGSVSQKTELFSIAIEIKWAYKTAAAKVYLPLKYPPCILIITWLLKSDGTLIYRNCMSWNCRSLCIVLLQTDLETVCFNLQYNTKVFKSFDLLKMINKNTRQSWFLYLKNWKYKRDSSIHECCQWDGNKRCAWIAWIV